MNITYANRRSLKSSILVKECKGIHTHTQEKEKIGEAQVSGYRVNYSVNIGE